MATSSAALSPIHQSAFLSPTVIILACLMLAYDSRQLFRRELQSTVPTPAITVNRLNDLEYQFLVQNYNRVINFNDNKKDLPLSPTYNTWVGYGYDEEYVSFYSVKNTTGFNRMSVRFTKGCLFPILAASFNMSQYPSLTVGTVSPYILIKDAYLGISGNSSVTKGQYRVFQNLGAPDPKDSASLYEQTIDFSYFLGRAEIYPIIYCALFMPGETTFEFEITLQKRPTRYEADISRLFNVTGNFNETRNIPYNSTYFLKANKVEGNATLSYSHSDNANITIKVEYDMMGEKKNSSAVDNVFSIEQCENLIIAIKNNDDLQPISINLKYDFLQGELTHRGVGHIIGIVLGVAGFLLVVTILVVFRKRISACLSKKYDYNSKFLNLLKKKQPPVDPNDNNIPSNYNGSVPTMSANNIGTYPELFDQKIDFGHTELDNLANKPFPNQFNNAINPTNNTPRISNNTVMNSVPVMAYTGGFQRITFNQDSVINQSTGHNQSVYRNQVKVVQSLKEPDIPLTKRDTMIETKKESRKQPVEQMPNRSDIVIDESRDLKVQTSNFDQKNV
jgi:hypothetical protein